MAKKRPLIFQKGGLQQIVLGNAIIKRLIAWSKENSLPGFENVPLYEVVLFSYKEISEDSITTRANSIAFSFFLSLFPILLVFFTLIPIILPLFQDYIIPWIAEDLIQRNTSGQVDFNQTIIAQFNELIDQVKVIPENAHQQLIDFITNILLEPRFGLLSVGFVLAIFFGSNGMITMMRGFEKHYQLTFLKRNVFQKRLVAIQLTFIIGFLVIASVIFIILGDTILSWLLGVVRLDGMVSVTLILLRYLTVFFLFYFGIAFIYRYGAPLRKKMDYFSAGATLATVLSVLTSFIFAVYVNGYGKYNDLYGSIGTFIVIMLWIQINAFILLIGYELNTAIAVRRDQMAHAKSKAEQEDEPLHILEEE